MLLAVLMTTGGARSESLAKTPYKLRVMIQMDEHPHFTNFFRSEFRRELNASLQTAFGPMCLVEIAYLKDIPREKWDPLCQLVADQGLESLDTYNDLSRDKTHFVQVRFVGGAYVIRSRQYDGTTGFATPIIRKEQTNARQFICRLVGLQIGMDFGMVATLEPGPGPRFFIHLQGADLGKMSSWIQIGEVFAVIRLQQERRKIAGNPARKVAPRVVLATVGKRLPDLLLRVVAQPAEGGVLCEMLNRYENPLGTPAALGFRCVKLGTISAPLKLQLVDHNGAPWKAAPLQVLARADGYPPGNFEGDRTINRDGIFTSKAVFTNVAYVRVLMGANNIARFPVEILDHNLAVRTIRLDPNSEIRDRLDADRRSILNRIDDGRLIQVRAFQDINEMEKVGKKQQALDRGQAILQLINNMASSLTEETDAVRVRAKKDLPKSADFVKDCEQRLLALQHKQDELKQHLEALNASIKEDMDPAVQEKKKQVNDLIRKAELLSSQADYEESLKTYQDAITLLADNPMAKARVEMVYQSLQKSWALKPGDAAHADARKFIYLVWARLGTIQDVRDQLMNARKAFDKCKSVGDRLSINKMNLAGIEVATHFEDEFKKLLDSAKDEEDKKKIEADRLISENLQKLLKDIQEYLLAAKK